MGAPWKVCISGLIPLMLWGQTSFSWIEHRALEWADFKGKPARLTGEPSAMTDTGFRTQLVCRDGMLDIQSVAEFYPETSWVIPDRKLERLLRHEQGHFDITEIYSRKMKKAIREARLGCDEAAGKKILSRLDREWEKAEKQYDVETRDGLDAVRQASASQRIAGELAELKDYAR